MSEPVLKRGRLIEGVFLGLGREVRAVAPRPALFLDRDGVVVDFVDYLYRPEDVRIARGAAEVIAAFNRAGVPVLVVTNQAGIGRGKYEWRDFEAVEGEIERQLAATGARLDAEAACPFHPEGRAGFQHPDHPCRKPNPGMLYLLADRLSLDLRRSWMVGDHITDIQAAERAKLAGVLQVIAGHGQAHRTAVGARPDFGTFSWTAESLADAAGRLFRAFGIEPSRSVGGR